MSHAQTIAKSHQPRNPRGSRNGPAMLTDQNATQRTYGLSGGMLRVGRMSHVIFSKLGLKVVK